MPSPLPFAVRHAIWQRSRAGHSAAAIAAELDLAPRTIRRIVTLLQQQGANALVPAYRSGRGPLCPAAVAAVALKREHPTWGAPLIRVMLLRQFPASEVPTPRSLQRRFAQAGLQPAAKGR